MSVNLLFRLEAALAIFLMLVMVAVAGLQMVVRYAPTESFDFFWTEELSRLIQVWLTFFGAAMVHRTDDHIVMPILFDMLPERLKLPVRLLGDATVLVVLGIVVWYGWTAAQLTQAQQTVGLGVSLAAFVYPVPIFGALMIIYTLFGVWRRIQGRPIISKYSPEV